MLSLSCFRSSFNHHTQSHNNFHNYHNCIYRDFINLTQKLDCYTFNLAWIIEEFYYLHITSATLQSVSNNSYIFQNSKTTTFQSLCEFQQMTKSLWSINWRSNLYHMFSMASSTTNCILFSSLQIDDKYLSLWLLVRIVVFCFLAYKLMTDIFHSTNIVNRGTRIRIAWLLCLRVQIATLQSTLSNYYTVQNSKTSAFQSLWEAIGSFKQWPKTCETLMVMSRLGTTYLVETKKFLLKIL